jgi:hypothetical protein
MSSMTSDSSRDPSNKASIWPRIFSVGDTRTDMGVVRPSDYASLAADKVDLDNVINELISRLEDHKYRWELYEYGLTDAVERQRVRAIIDHLQAAAVHTGGPAVLNPLRHALFTAE